MLALPRDLSEVAGAFTSERWFLAGSLGKKRGAVFLDILHCLCVENSGGVSRRVASARKFLGLLLCFQEDHPPDGDNQATKVFG